MLKKKKSDQGSNIVQCGYVLKLLRKSIYCDIAFRHNKRPVINPAIIQPYHCYPHRLTEAGLLDDIVFITVTKVKFNYRLISQMDN